MNQIQILEKEIAKLISRSLKKEDPIHSLSTRKWVLRLKSNADESLQIAALAHDIDRAYDEGKIPVEDFGDYEKHKKEHAQRSAAIIAKLLSKHHFDQNFINRVKSLVKKHETGGDSNSDVLKNADSISFFEHNIYFYLEEYGSDKLAHKIGYMFKRSSKEAQAIMKDFKFKDPKIKNIFKKVIIKIK